MNVLPPTAKPFAPADPGLETPGRDELLRVEGGFTPQPLPINLNPMPMVYRYGGCNPLPVEVRIGLRP